MKTLILTFLMLSLSYSFFPQGKIDGFYRGKGKGTIVLGLGFEDSQAYFAGKEKVDLTRNLYYVNLFSAYGISEHMDVQVSIPYMQSNDNKAFQDISLFLKYRFLQKTTKSGSLQLSFGAGFSTPLSDYPIGDLNDLGQKATIIETRTMLHYQNNTNWFGSIQTGFSYKLQEVPNSIPFAFKVGKASAKGYFDIFYEYQHALGGNDYLGSPRPQNFREFGVDYHKIGGSVYKPLSSDVGAYLNASYLLSGRNTFIGPSYGLGFVYNF